MQEYKVIVNCTPVGMYPKADECPNIPYELLTPQHLLYDLLYNPNTTLFMKKGSDQGASRKEWTGNAPATGFLGLGTSGTAKHFILHDTEEKNWLDSRNSACTDSGYLHRRKPLPDRLFTPPGKPGKEYGGI